MSEFKIHFPEDFSEYAALYLEPKGHCFDVPVEWKGQMYVLDFYDPVRLRQDLEAELEIEALVSLQNTVVLKRLSQEGIVQAVTTLVETGKLANFKAGLAE